MPNLTHEQAIKEYWEEVKDKYPDLTFEQFERVCRSPFKAIKLFIKQDNFPIICLKYIGKFMVFPSGIKTRLKNIERYFSAGLMDEEKYNKRKEYYERYMREVEHTDRIIEIIDDEEEKKPE